MNSTTPILLVEDDPDDRLFFTRAAHKAGITRPVQAANDGQQAIDYLAGAGEFADRTRHPLPGLIVLDLKLPRATGFEVLEYVRGQPDLRSLIVVIMTSSQSEDDIAKAYGLGANGYLVKPSAPEKLLSLLLAIKEFWLTHNQPPPMSKPRAGASN